MEALKLPRPILKVKSLRAWEGWLTRNHASSPGIFLRIPKGPDGAFNYAQALEVALTWGWIDSQKRALDASAWLQCFSPRTARSPWSRINRDKAEALIAQARMHPPGLVEVERARKDGRWTRAYESARTVQVPEDLTRALAQNRKAQAFFQALDAANRYAILWRVLTAVKPATRADRIQRLVARCARHETLHPSRAKKPARASGHSTG